MLHTQRRWNQSCVSLCPSPRPSCHRLRLSQLLVEAGRSKDEAEEAEGQPFLCELYFQVWEYGSIDSLLVVMELGMGCSLFLQWSHSTAEGKRPGVGGELIQIGEGLRMDPEAEVWKQAGQPGIVHNVKSSETFQQQQLPLMRECQSTRGETRDRGWCRISIGIHSFTADWIKMSKASRYTAEVTRFALA